MNTIEKLLSYATVAETCDVAVTAAKIIKINTAEDEYLTEITHVLDSLGNQMVNSIAADRKKELTEEISLSDTKRDNDFQALKGFIKAYLGWKNPKYTQAAKRLFSILKNHGLGLADEGYEAESALLDSLINDLNKEEASSDIALLKLDEQKESLIESQQAFKNIYQQSVVSEAGKETVVAATKLRKEIFKALNEVIDYINTMSKARPEIYGGPAKEVAELIANVNQKIRTRRNRKGGE